MIASLFSLASPLFGALDPETAHQLAIRTLSLMPAGAPPRDDPRLAVAAFGRRFPNPVGLAPKGHGADLVDQRHGMRRDASWGANLPWRTSRESTEKASDRIAFFCKQFYS